MLEEWIIHMCQIRYGPTRVVQLTLKVKAILDKDGRPNAYQPSSWKGWVRAVMSRHPKLTLRKSQKLSIACTVSVQ